MRSSISFLFLSLWMLSTFFVKAERLSFRHFDVGNGLSNNSVNKIIKDSKGFLWIATESGLNRYDGYTFKVYRSMANDTLSLPDNFIEDIVEAGDYCLWIKTARGYTVFDGHKETFTHNVSAFMQRMGCEKQPGCVFADSQNRLWLYVSGEGCYCYDYKTGNYRIFSFQSHNLPENGIIDIAECLDGILLLYDNGRLVCVDSETLTKKWQEEGIVHQMEEGEYGVDEMFVDREGWAWIYGTSGLWAYDCRTRKFKNELLHEFTAKTFMVHAAAQDGTGKIWLGLDNHGIMIIDKNKKSFFPVTKNEDEEHSLSHNTVYSLYSDSLHTMWIGTYKTGLSCYADCMYKFDFEQAGDVTCIEEMEDGTLLLGTNNSGLVYRTAPGQHSQMFNVKNRMLESNTVVSLCNTKDKKIWVGTFQGGLTCINGNTSYTYRRKAGGLADDNVWSLTEDDEGNLWIATLGGGLQCFSDIKQNFVTYNTKNSNLPEDYLSHLYIWNKQTLCIGTATQGVCCMDLNTRVITVIPELSHYSVNQLFVDSRDLLWVAAREGIAVYDLRTKRLVSLPECEELEGKPISGIAEDKEHHIWLTVSNKILCFSLSLKKRGSFEISKQLYDKNDGLQNSDFNQRSIRMMHNGTIVVGGLYGINLFTPEHIVQNCFLPKVMFTSVSLWGKPVEVGKRYGNRIILHESIVTASRIDFDYNQKNICITFGTDNLILPEKTQYTYKLEGLDDYWITLPAGVNEVNISNLSPGTYRLLVKATNSDGYANDTPASLQLVVHPPFWMSPWAYGIYVLAIVACLWWSRYYLLKREREKFRIRQIELEAQQKEELNAVKFRFFTNISHELRTPLTLIISPLEKIIGEINEPVLRTQLEMIHRNAMRLLHLVNQLLDFRKGENGKNKLSLSEGDVIGYIHGVCDSFLQLAEEKHLHFSFFAGIDELTMAFDADKLNKIVMNLLSNAFKFTPDGGRVTVIIEKLDDDGGVLEIKISDTGIGISEEDKAHIFERFYQSSNHNVKDTTGTGIGLSLVADFVSLHGGDVKVFDNIGVGSVFVVHIPIRHLKRENIIETVSKNEVLQIESGVCDKSVAKNRQELSKVLIVDDNSDFRDFMSSCLALEYDIRTATDGVEAWTVVQEWHPDLVLSDLMMPQMDGKELCRLIKQTPLTAHIPVILLTARQAEESKLEGLQTGADDYVTKPFNMEILALRIRKLIEWKRYSCEGKKLDPAPSNIVITSLDEKLIEKAIKYVEDNISKSELSVEELSRELGMSRVHLYKKLLQITGKTPIEFIRVIRLKRAAQLLRESQLHVSEVAFEVGFNNPKYFSRYFKEEFGVLPSVYQGKEGK